MSKKLVKLEPPVKFNLFFNTDKSLVTYRLKYGKDKLGEETFIVVEIGNIKTHANNWVRKIVYNRSRVSR